MLGELKTGEGNTARCSPRWEIHCKMYFPDVICRSGSESLPTGCDSPFDACLPS